MPADANYRSFTEQYLDSTGIFKEAVIGILAAVAKQERVRLSERTIAGLQRAKAQGRVGGRPKAGGCGAEAGWLGSGDCGRRDAVSGR